MHSSLRLNSKNGLRSALVAVVAFAGITSAAQAAGFATGGVGLRARAMGGTFRGMANDWSAMSYNPAGLAKLTQNEVHLSLGTASPDVTYTPSIAEGGIDIGYQDVNGVELIPGDNVVAFPSLAVAMKPSGRFNLAYGAAVVWTHDANYQWDLFDPPVGYNTDFVFHPTRKFHTEMDVMDIQPTLAKSFGENLALGVGLAIRRGDIVFRRILHVPNTLGEGLDDYPISSFYGDYRMDGNGVGVGVNAGLLFDISENLTLGLSGRSPVTIPMAGAAEIDMAWPNNPTRFEIERGLGRERSFFIGVSDPVFSAPSFFRRDFEYDMKVPGDFGGGISISAGQKLILAADVVMTFWSSVDSWDIQFDDDGLSVGVDTLKALTIPFGWEDQIRISAGAEYMVQNNLALRGGFYYDGTAAVDSTFSPNFPDVGARTGISAGLSYTIDNVWELGAVQEISFASERDVPSAGEADGITVYPGTYTLTRFETLLGVSYRF